MDNGQLSAELERLERLLAARPQTEPTTELRERVISGALRQFRRQRLLRLTWLSAATLAASVLLSVACSYLFLAAFDGHRPAGHDEVGRFPPVEAPRKRLLLSGPGTGMTVVVSSHPVFLSTPELARRIRLLSPELAPEEATRRAVLLQIGAATGAQSTLANQLRDLNLSEPSENVHPDHR